MLTPDTILGALQKKLQAESTDLVRKCVDEFLPRLVKDLNVIASIKTETARTGPLTFSAAVSPDRRTIVVTPSDPELFKRLEFGEFDERGRMVSPPHSVLQGLQVLVKV